LVLPLEICRGVAQDDKHAATQRSAVRTQAGLLIICGDSVSIAGIDRDVQALFPQS